MRMLIAIWLGIVLVSADGALHAQEYEQGSGIAGCQAGSGVCNGWQWQQPNNQQQLTTAPASDPSYKWQSRWGAIATDAAQGALGFSSGIESGSSAEKAAINDCRTKGGVNCTIQVSYSNACGAVVVGDTVFNANWGNSVQEAVKKGIDMCNKASTNCHAYFTTCSPPVLVH